MSNYITVVNAEIEARIAELPSPRPRSEVFDVLASEIVLKHFDLTADEVEAGLTDGGGDGGVDSAYVFVNQELLTEEHELLKGGFAPGAAYRGASVSLWVVQAKEQTTFKSGTLVTVTDGLRDLLDDSKERAQLLSEGYSNLVLDRIFEFREAVRALRRLHPATSVNFAYVTLGDVAAASATVKTKSKALERVITQDLGVGTQTVTLIGAKELWDGLRDSPNYGSELRVLDSLAHETATGERSYVCLVAIKDYLKFISDEQDGSYRDYLFDGNVRHHEGAKASVNREISEGLADQDAPEFWWMNNGITVICSAASSQGKTFALDDVQVVNGLQTSRTIYESLSAANPADPALQRHVLVRIIESDDPKTVNKVIRATNRQTPVKEESLRATDEVQLLIDRHMQNEGLYYDRRRNYYRNIGKPRSKIVAVKGLTQALLAIVFSKPDDARARPGDYLSDDGQYATVFNEHANVQIYPWVFRAQKMVDGFLNAMDDMTTSEKNDSRFIVSSDIVARKLGYLPSAAEHILSLGNVEDVITESEVARSIADLRSAFAKEMASSGSARDKLAKSKLFTGQFLGRRSTSRAG